jgi:hypothetical protein
MAYLMAAGILLALVGVCGFLFETWHIAERYRARDQ